MSSELSINNQISLYEQFYLQHQTTRREYQGQLIEPVQRLYEELQGLLADDKQAYGKAKENYHQEFNVFKRVFNRSAAEHESQFVLPIKELYQQRKDLTKKVSDLLNEIRLETAPVELRKKWNESIAVVYNPITGRAEWKQHWHGGVHGVFNPLTGVIEWREKYRSGVYGVFNPRLNEIEWKIQYDSGVHGVYNPSLGIVEWKTSRFDGIGGVYNPLTKQVEWKTCYRGAVAGYYDYQTKSVNWTEEWHCGIALIVWDPVLQTYVTTASCGWFGGDD